MAGLVCVGGRAERKGWTQAWESVASRSLGSREGSHNPLHMPGPLLPASRPARPLRQGEQVRALWDSESLLGQPGGLREELGAVMGLRAWGGPAVSHTAVDGGLA